LVNNLITSFVKGFKSDYLNGNLLEPFLMKTVLTKKDYVNLLEWSLRHYSARDDLLLAVNQNNPIPLCEEWKHRFSFDVKTSLFAFNHLKSIVESSTGTKSCNKCGKDFICGMPDPCMGRIKYVSHGCRGHEMDYGYIFFSERDLSIHFTGDDDTTFDIRSDKQSGMCVTVYMPVIHKEKIYKMIDDSINYQTFKKDFFTIYPKREL
jgi:hypothetical protein